MWKRFKIIIYQLVIVVIAVITLNNFAGATEPSEAPPVVNLNGTDCIWVRTVRDYTVLDERNLLIHGSGKRSYFVTLLHPSFEIRSSTGLGFSTRDGQLCPYGGDSIIVGGLSREEVRIRSISQVSTDQAEQLKVRFGRGQANEPQVVAPKPLEGAKVEELD